MNDAPLAIEALWSSTALEGHLKFSDGASGASQEITKSGADAQQYLILNGSQKDFKSIDEDSGLPAPPYGAVIVDLLGTSTDTLSVSLKVMEYGADGNRLAMRTVRLSESNKRLDIAPETSKLLIAIRLAGQGVLRLDNLKIRLFAAGRIPEKHTARSSAVSANKATASPPTTAAPIAPDFLSGVSMSATQSAAGILNGAFGSILSLVESLETNRAAPEEVRKWKRRALGWEEKAKESFARAAKPLAGLNKELLQITAIGLPTSNGVRHFRPLPIRLGIVTDIYMFNYYKDCCDEVVYLSPDNYAEELERKALDAFIYVTCWKGIEDEEWRGVKFREKPQKALDAILAHCAEHDIPSIFQTIEDPSNYEYFLPVAQKFDHIFTSDVEMVERYREDCDTDSVHYGEYGANPCLNNPVGCRRVSLESFFFAGSYPKRYADRCEDMDIMFDSIVDWGGDLVIADRNYGSEDKNLAFPHRFSNRIIPPLDHEVLQPIHKLFRFNLNFNSIKGSPTMCAMRIYELQAQGKTIYSNYAHSVFNKFHNVRILPRRDRLGALTGIPERIEEYRSDMAAVRDVMTDRTSFDIVGRMMKIVGVVDPDPIATGVCVLVDGDAPDGWLDRFRKAQTYGNIIEIREGALENDGAFTAFCEEHSIAYLTWLNPQNDYGPNYIQDLVNAFKYTNARYVVRDDIFAYANGTGLPHHDYVEMMPDRCRTLFSVQAMSREEIVDTKGSKAIKGGYCIDPFSLNYDKYVQSIQPATDQNDFVLSVIVPTFNNGSFLESKCIASLLRNELFERMDVILVDDGSTDDETLSIVSRLAENYSNIRYYAFEAGGSGSASRPRNKGIELAVAPLIAFLDPDNEISIGGYDQLVRQFAEASETDSGSVDFVSGYQVKVTEKTRLTGRHANGANIRVDNLRDHFFARGRFPVISTQAAVIDRRLFDDESFRFVERAAGQDTLFGWELISRASAGIFTDDAHLIYFAGREGSVTNSVGSRYFEKMLIMEEAQVDALKRHDLFDNYRTNHFEKFLTGWYLHKLQQVPDHEVERARANLKKIVQLYEFETDRFDF